MKATKQNTSKATKAAYNSNDKTQVQALDAKVKEFCKANYNKKLVGDVTCGDIGVMDYHSLNRVAQYKGIYKPYFQFLKVEEKRAAVLGLFSAEQLDAVIAAKREIVEAKQTGNGEGLAKYHAQIAANKASLEAKLNGTSKPKAIPTTKPVAKVSTKTKTKTDIRSK